MPQQKAVPGFSKLTAEEKIRWLRDTFDLPDEYISDIHAHLHNDPRLQELYGEFSENTISNFFIPYGLAPNFLINGKWYVVPFAIEESSVVAAASQAAKFWSAHGGFKAEVADAVKVGQVHFYWTGNREWLSDLFPGIKDDLTGSLLPLTRSMEKRGGGILDMQLLDKTGDLDNYYQIFVKFRTANAMGANFINSVLEALAKNLKEHVDKKAAADNIPGAMEISMAILSNYTPECVVKVSVEAGVETMDKFSGELTGMQFAEKFVRATEIARCDTYRAVTHNKGIFNGMDGVVIATGNDFRAVEACGHAYAARNNKYSSLSHAEINGSIFHFELETAMAVGTVGGLTTGHPLARTSLKILQEPDAEELMMVIAAAGLANNFSAVRSLITSGIQQGHMKMHLTNILRQLGADENQKKEALEYFSNKTVSFADVKKFLAK
ncbi:MAG: hydroxymethylglutaryl-CoA reductase [Bacteroidales bacterium]|nr:hydroxymethylglutaryl-CoA reductase [Bacteroidales bacterium]